MKKILLVEDDPAIRMAIQDDLTFEGYSVDLAENGPDGLLKGLSGIHDLIILDLMLPGGSDGLDICKEIRKNNLQTPIIMLTAKSQDYDKVIGLELGADDYVTKPYSPHELRARVKAVLRRSNSKPLLESKPVINVGPLHLDVGKQECRLGDYALTLSTLQVSLLQLFMDNPGQVISRQDILDIVWGPDVLVTPRTIDTHIGNLRKKICTPDYPGNAILSIRGLGYKLVLD